MGISQRVLAAQCASHPLYMDKLPSHGITTTHAANRFITDSAAAVTALAGGGLVDIENKRAGNTETEYINALDLARNNGYTIATSLEEFRSFSPGDGRLIAMPAGSGNVLPYELDRGEGEISLAQLIRKGIELLQGDSGFFMMVEGGKIDWACHANDAATAVADILAFDEAIGPGHEAFASMYDNTDICKKIMALMGMA